MRILIGGCLIGAYATMGSWVSFIFFGAFAILLVLDIRNALKKRKAKKEKGRMADTVAQDEGAGSG